jgi:hypothetical protein
MNKQLKIGDKVRFFLGETPMTGEILFAFGPNAAAVKLAGGTEIVIDLDTIK